MSTAATLWAEQLSLDDLETVELAGRRLVVVVPCSAEKRAQDPAAGVYAYPAGELYLGSFHRYARTHAARLGAEVLILSAGSGLLPLDRMTPPYDKKITDKDSIISTPGLIARQAALFGLLDPDTVVVSLCPAAYTAVLASAIPELVTPLAGSRGIGEQRGRIARLTRYELEVSR